MKKAFLTAALALTLGCAAVAQTTTPQTTNPQTTPGTMSQGQTPAANATTLTGCLAGPNNGVYTLRTLTDSKVYTLRSANPLSSHDNHAVTVTGSFEANATTTASSTASGTNPSASSTASGSTAGAATGNVSGTNPSTNPSATASGSAQTSTSTSSSAPVFTVTSISMANESCELGSSAVGTTTPTTSATGQMSTGQSTTASSQTSAPTNPSSSTAAAGGYGQTTAPTSTQPATSQPSTSGQYGTTTQSSTSMAGAQGTSISGCLLASNRDAGRFMLRTTKGKKFVTEVIPSSEIAANFSEHVGHQVRLTGQFTDTSASTTMAQANKLPQSDQPERGKKAHEQDRDTGRQFTASNVEMISASGCPQSSTTPNKDKSKKMKHEDKQKDQDK